MNVRWPPKLQHLSMSGSVSGKFLWDILRQPDKFPPSFYSLSVLHSPALDYQGIKMLLCSLADTLTVMELRNLPAVKHGRFNGVLDWLPNLTTLTIALDYIDTRFGHMPPDFSSMQWQDSKPLQSLTLVTSGRTSDPSRSFTPIDLYTLIDERFLGRLRYLNIARSTEWELENEGAELAALDSLLVEELDKENWLERRWHYQWLEIADTKMTYERWIGQTGIGRRMKPSMRILKNR